MDLLDFFLRVWNGVAVALILIIPVVGIFDAGPDEGVEDE